MSQSRQYVVLAAVVAALGAGAYHCRLADFAVAELPADNVIPEQESAMYEDTDDVDVTFRFHIRHIVAVSGPVGADQAADARYVRGAQLLLADPTLGGLVRRLKLVSRKWDRERGEEAIIACVATYEAEFSTSVSDPSVAGY